MKKTPIFTLFSALIAAPGMLLAQEEAAAKPAESAAPAAAETSVVEEASEAVTEAAEAVAVATAEAAEAVTGSLVSVFQTASKKDAWDLRLSAFWRCGDNRDSVPDGYDTHHDGDRYGYVKEKDVVYGIQPSATLTGSFAANSNYKIGYSPIYQYWSNPRVGSLRKELSHAAVLEYRYILDRRNEFTVRDQFKYIENDYWYLGSADVENYHYVNRRRTEHEQAHYDNTLTGVWRTQISERTAMRLQAYWMTIRYEDEDLAAMNDEDKYSVLADLFRSYNAQWSYGVFGKYEEWDDSGVNWLRGDSEQRRVERGIATYTLGFSGTHRSSARMSINARYGWQWIDYDDETIEDRDYPGDGDISVTYAFTLRSKGTIGFRYGVTEAWVYPYASQDLYSFYSMLRTRHTQRLFSTLRLEYKIEKFDSKYIPNALRHEDYVTSKGDKKDFYGEIALGYRWSKNFDFNVIYNYEEIDSDVSTSYHENTIGVRATYLF